MKRKLWQSRPHMIQSWHGHILFMVNIVFGTNFQQALHFLIICVACWVFFARSQEVQHVSNLFCRRWPTLLIIGLLFHVNNELMLQYLWMVHMSYSSNTYSHQPLKNWVYDLKLFSSITDQLMVKSQKPNWVF